MKKSKVCDLFSFPFNLFRFKKGVDSPTNIAIISNIAELVTRSFSKNTNTNQPTPTHPQNVNGWDRRQMTERYPTEHLEDFGETPQSTHQGNSNEDGGNIDDNVIIGNNFSTQPTTTTSVDNGFLGQILRVMGMDSSKIGALAVNGLIFIAQMVCFTNIFVFLLFFLNMKFVIRFIFGYFSFYFLMFWLVFDFPYIFLR